MIHRLAPTVFAAMLGSAAVAQVVAPTEVEFTDGAIEASLSGAAGDPENGAVLMNKGAGNCIACHAVDAH